MSTNFEKACQIAISMMTETSKSDAINYAINMVEDVSVEYNAIENQINCILKTESDALVLLRKKSSLDEIIDRPAAIEDAATYFQQPSRYFNEDGTAFDENGELIILKDKKDEIISEEDESVEQFPELIEDEDDELKKQIQAEIAESEKEESILEQEEHLLKQERYKQLFDVFE